MNDKINNFPNYREAFPTPLAPALGITIITAIALGVILGMSHYNMNFPDPLVSRVMISLGSIALPTGLGATAYFSRKFYKNYKGLPGARLEEARLEVAGGGDLGAAAAARPEEGAEAARADLVAEDERAEAARAVAGGADLGAAAAPDAILAANNRLVQQSTSCSHRLSSYRIRPSFPSALLIQCTLLFVATIAMLYNYINENSSESNSNISLADRIISSVYPFFFQFIYSKFGDYHEYRKTKRALAAIPSNNARQIASVAPNAPQRAPARPYVRLMNRLLPQALSPRIQETKRFVNFIIKGLITELLKAIPAQKNERLNEAVDELVQELEETIHGTLDYFASNIESLPALRFYIESVITSLHDLPHLQSSAKNLLQENYPHSISARIVFQGDLRDPISRLLSDLSELAALSIDKFLKTPLRTQVMQLVLTKEASYLPKFIYNPLEAAACTNTGLAFYTSILMSLLEPKILGDLTRGLNQAESAMMNSRMYTLFCKHEFLDSKIPRIKNLIERVATLYIGIVQQNSKEGISTNELISLVTAGERELTMIADYLKRLAMLKHPVTLEELKNGLERGPLKHAINQLKKRQRDLQN